MGCFEIMVFGSCKGVMSLSFFFCFGFSEFGEFCRELVVVRLVIVFIDWVGELCCEFGYMVEVDELLIVDGGIMMSWVCDGGIRFVWIWLGCEECLFWRRLGVMGEEVEGSNGCGELVEMDMILMIVVG